MIPVADFETMKPELIDKVKRDSRSKIIDQALVDSLKEKYEVQENEQALTYFQSILNSDYFKHNWALPNDFTSDKVFLNIKEKQISYQDFGDYLLNTQRQSRKTMPLNQLVHEKYQAFLKDELIAYQELHLEAENEEYASVVHEYRDGLLLFELMENTIWNTGQTDSLQVKKYYESHQSDYFFPERIDAVIASSSKKKTVKTVSKMLEANQDVETIKSAVNKNGAVEVIFTSGVVEANHQGLPKDIEFKKGVSKIFKHNDAFVVVQVKEVFQKKQKTFEEAKGLVVNDYQSVKEAEWLDSLEAKYPVTVDQEVFKKVKNELK